MFYLIGLGLEDPKDITVKGLEIVQQCSRVYLEMYTSIMGCPKEELEAFYGRPILMADRDLIEVGAEEMLAGAAEEDIALLVVGDPFAATTHTDFILTAKAKKIPYKVIHNASIMNAIGCCGLQLYKFGESVSIPFWDENWKPDFYNKIKLNRQYNLHTLCLLDIKIQEPTLESLLRGRVNYNMLPRYMTVSEGAQQLVAIVKKKDVLERNTILNEESLCVGLARVGHHNQRIVVKTLRDMASTDLGPPLHTIVIPAKEMHPVEVEFLQQFANFKIDDYNY